MFVSLFYFNNILIIYRWGNTPLDEARIGGNKNLIQLLENAKRDQLTKFPKCSMECQGINYVSKFPSASCFAFKTNF